MPLDPANWFFCEQCDSVEYHFNCCGNSSCNAGGCDQCRGTFDEVVAAMRAGEVPPKESVPYEVNSFESIMRFAEERGLLKTNDE